ncbi:unnamed protein product, partial [Rotaria socialis]
MEIPSSLCTSDELQCQFTHESSLSNSSNCSKRIDVDSSSAARLPHKKLLHKLQSQNTKSVDLSNLTRRKSCL